ncbi:S-methyl-5-thioribose kinase [Peribacillus cavernae]|uniref:Methylthioribose kinase n=1 Tax=Peribacillus cavernae TaxID=1674310 RepID=A0A433HW95_9BACI|nr:S-methyl-5-thioribose kinase [Peribacillus cavernae]MDQ0217937.1 5-methylthioribose kinase [Peribacillus cavernae]RUQ32588.1 S-methyl-5-thioribose kinase [Peribacillus cavernae]
MNQQPQSAYEPLSEGSAILLTKKLGLFNETASLECREIGDGNLNYVFHITDSNSRKGIIIKQALPFAKVIGEAWPLTLKRAVIEANALKLFGKLCPEYVPEVYYADEELAITVMEDLSHLTITRTGFIEGESYPLLSRHIGEYMAKTLFHTSDFAIEHGRKKELAVQFSNPELCKITESFVFTDPFFDVESNDFEEELKAEVVLLWNDSELQLEAAKLKKSFITEQEALLHGDLHTGSIFACETETKVIDPEFAFYGPIGFDVGQFFANLLFQAITRKGKDRELMFKHVEVTWDVFTETFRTLWENEGMEAFCKTKGYLDYILQKILEDAFGFAGCELIRRTIGLSHVKDLDGIENTAERIAAKKAALQAGKILIKQRKNKTDISFIINTVKKPALTVNY